MKYRLLINGEDIQKGDECLSDDASTWEKVSIHNVGKNYSSLLLWRPMRRPKEGEPAPEQKTITVRIAVAVDPKTGKWNAAGWELDSTRADLGRPTDREKMDDATSLIEGEALRHWVEAVIPIPESPVIIGRVTEGE